MNVNSIAHKHSEKYYIKNNGMCNASYQFYVHAVLPKIQKFQLNDINQAIKLAKINCKYP